MSPMLPNPLTPPTDHPELFEDIGDIGDDDDDIILGTPKTASAGQLQFHTPQSDSMMGLEGLDERLDMDDRLEPDDEDQDMSEGGVTLAMPLSHAEELNAEMDMVDAEVMGAENLVGLFLDTQPPAQLEDAFHNQNTLPEPQQSFEQATQEIAVQTEEIFPTQPVALASDIPIIMTGASQQLQQIQSEQLQQVQDGQEHGDFDDTAEELVHFNHSTYSTLLAPQLLTASASVDLNSPEISVSLADISTTNNSSASAGLANPPALDVVVPSEEQNPSLNQPPVGSLFTTTFHFLETADDMSDADLIEVDDQMNLSLGGFLYNWGQSSLRGDEERRRRGPSLLAIERLRTQKLEPVHLSDLQGERCDIQRVNWMDLGVSRLEAKQLRRKTYQNYTNLHQESHPRHNSPGLIDDQNFFRFRQMDFEHQVHLSHFQLRNLVACASRDHIFYAGRAKVMQWNPRARTAHSEPENPAVAMDLSDPIIQPAAMNGFSGSVQISTLTVAHDILVAGGWCGEYGLVNLRAHKDTKHTEGLITNNINSITNHVQVHLSRSSSLPLAAFASNDTGMRILDVNTNTFIAEHKYDHPINCSAISPDQRLRVLVGDTNQVMICNADTGEILQSLEGHHDYGFACDWADDGWTVATGNQDMQVKIWDARKWTTSQGLAYPVATVEADMAGVRKLKFSPLGSGKRVLVAAEPADIVSVIDAESFQSKQTLSFFGEIGGVDFTNNGQDLIVANCDNLRGGLMEYERCGHGGSSLYELDHRPTISRHRRRKAGYDWLSSDEKIVRHPNARGTEEQRRRKAALLGITMGHF